VALTCYRGRALLREQADRIAVSEARYRDLAERSPDAIWHLGPDAGPRLDYLSPSCQTITGIGPDHLGDDARTFVATIDPDGVSTLGGLLSNDQPLSQVGTERFFSTIEKPNGTTVVLETQVAGVPNGVQGITRDMTDIGRLQAQLTEQAMRDPLTGLANRRLLDELLARALRRARRRGETVTVAFLDLDGFKHINDKHGHQAGDVVLRETATRLRAAVRATDVVSRVGGDEFVLVWETPGELPELVATKIAEALAAPVEIAPGVLVDCTASIGLADTRQLGYDAVILLNTADARMYESKRVRAGAHARRDMVLKSR
jgi:diguanylate cyclase (GGDEF)-like protein/PAS domain S-box-containing protein